MAYRVGYVDAHQTTNHNTHPSGDLDDPVGFERFSETTANKQRPDRKSQVRSDEEHPVNRYDAEGLMMMVFGRCSLSSLSMIMVSHHKV